MERSNSDDALDNSKFDAIRSEIQKMLLGLPDLKFMLSRKDTETQLVR